MSLKVSISQTLGKTVLSTATVKKSGGVAGGDLRGYLSQSRNKQESVDLRSRLDKQKEGKMGMEEEPKMRSKWDVEEEEADSGRKHHAEANNKLLNKENTKEKHRSTAGEEKKKKKKSAENEECEDPARVHSQKKKKKKRNASRSPTEKKASRTSRSRSRGRKRSRSPVKSQKPLTDKLAEKLSGESGRERRGSRSRGRGGDRKRKHSPERRRGSSPSTSRREKERKRSPEHRERESSPVKERRERERRPTSSRTAPIKEKEKKRNRSVSKDKEAKKKKKKSKDKREKGEHKEKKDREGKKEKKTSPKKLKLVEEVENGKEEELHTERSADDRQEESETERKRRKSRVDSGISTGSGLGTVSSGQEPSLQPKENPTEPEAGEAKQPRLSSKVSDSPLSGPSLSPTPPRSQDGRGDDGGWDGPKEEPVVPSLVLVRLVSESPSPPRRQEADSTATGVEATTGQWTKGGDSGSEPVAEGAAKIEVLVQQQESHMSVSDVFDSLEEERKKVQELDDKTAVTKEKAEDTEESKTSPVNGQGKMRRKEDDLDWKEEAYGREGSRGLAQVGREKRREHQGYEREDNRHSRRYPEGSLKESGRHGERYVRDRTSEVVERPRDRRRNRSMERRERERDRTRRRQEPTPEHQRRDRSTEHVSRAGDHRRNWDRRDRDYSERDRYETSRRYSEEQEYRSHRSGSHLEGGGLYPARRDDYQRRYSCEYSRHAPAASSAAGDLDWTEKVQKFLESTRTPTLVELPRDTSCMGGSLLSSFDPSKPPPLMMAANPVPDYAAVAAYSDPTVPSLDGTGNLMAPDVAALYTPYKLPQGSIPSLMSLSAPLLLARPPTSASSLSSSSPLSAGLISHPPRYDAHRSSVERNTVSHLESTANSNLAKLYPAPMADIHTAVCVDERKEEDAEQQRASREREMKPLTAKEKRRLEMSQKEVWQYVGRKIFNDKIFLRRRKRKGSSPEEDKEELKKAEKCAVRLALKLEKAGYSESRLWHLLKDNQKGIQGFYDEMKTAVLSNAIEVDKDARKVKDKLDAELLLDGTVFKYIGEYIQANPFQMNKTRRLSSAESLATTTSQQVLPSNNDLQNILQFAKSLAPTTPAATAASNASAQAQSTRPDQLVPQEGESAHAFAVRSLADLRNFIAVQLVRTLQMEVGAASDTAVHYVETLAKAGFNFASLRDTVTNFQPPEPEFEDEPVQSVYGHLLDCLRNLAFEKYPKDLSESNLDAHLTNIVRISLDYFTRRTSQSRLSRTPSPKPQPSVRTVGEEEAGFIGPLPPCETVPVGGNTTNQLPQRRYVLVSVSVDTVPVEGRLVVWQISVHIPSLPDNEDPDYECLMLPSALREGRLDMLANLGFTYDTERGMFYHQGTEFGRRKADPEEVSLEKFTNYLDEMRSGLRGAGPNNGLVLLFETGEDLALVQQLLSRHSHDIFLDVVKGVTCLDHFLRVTRPGRPATYSWPAYQYRVGEGGRWTASVSSAGSAARRIEAETKPECIYNICENLLGTPPSFNNFIKWYSYPLNHTETSRMTSSLEHILELLPLQNHIDRQLFTNRVPIVLEGVYAARSEVEAARPHNACARQTIRRLVSLGFTLDVLKKSFAADPKYEIPSSVFLQDMSEVQKLRVHGQTDQIRGIIKQYFVRSA